MLQIMKRSHCDHGLTAAHKAWMLKKFKGKNGFFIETVEMPDHLAPLMSGVHGPIVGDEPVVEAEVTYVTRGTRKGPSRLVDREPRESRLMTVVAGARDGVPCGLFTAYGGPSAPREPWDKSMNKAEKAESKAFWAQHGLSK